VAKEIKTARAAALSVGIFMMTGAGAVPVFSSPAAYLSIAESPLSGRSFVHLDRTESGAVPARGNLGLTRFVVDDVPQRLPAQAAWTHSGLGAMTPGYGVLPITSFEPVRSYALVELFTPGELLTIGSTQSNRDYGFESRSGSSLPDAALFGATSTGIPGSYALAITGLATLPFIRRRRLGPVPFE
jgi:hypothetical protein